MTILEHLLRERQERQRLRRRAIMDVVFLVLLVAFCAAVAWLMLAITS